MTQTVLIVEDDRALAEALGETVSLAGYRAEVAANAMEALAALTDAPPALVVSDVHMTGMDGHALLRRIKAKYPELPVLLMTAYGSIEKAVAAMRDGAADYLPKPFEAEALVAAVTRFIGPPADELDGEPVVGDPRSRQLFQLAARVAHSEATILITGESGTGKEVVARFLHRHSRRARGPFVAINCAAIPENMLESTLFGYEKGAFTGAYKATPGKFEQAQGGTLLLDEVSEMALGLQAKLLRVLQEKEVERLGGRELIKLDVRVLATSNRNLRGEMQAGRFREDLYYRLSVFPLHLPPLRDRPGDILPIAERALLQAAVGREVPTLSPAARQRLLAYDWPGNVRELDNLMQRAVILADGEIIEPDHLHFEADADAPGPSAVTPVARAGGDLEEGLRDHEYQLILDALNHGSRQAAAKKLGISPRTLRYKLARMREAGYPIPAG